MKRDLADIVAAAPAKPATVDHVMISLDLIDVPPNRLRPADPDYVNLYADKLNDGEEAPPIDIRPRDDEPGRYWLVAGLHRLCSHALVERAAISSRILMIGETEARLREIGENLHRAELSALDRALNLAELKRVREEQHPETKHGGKRRGKVQVAESATRFSADAAARTGLSERSIQQAVALADALSPKAIELIRETYLTDHASDLQALSRLSDDEQVRAVRSIASGKAKTLKEAVPALGRGDSKADTDEAAFQKLIDGWSRANTKVRRRFLAAIEVAGGAGTAGGKGNSHNGGKGNGEAARQEPKKRD